MNDHDEITLCEQALELAKENPEEAAVIIEMLKAAGEDCEPTPVGEARPETEH